jgi:voltage-gated potassium channel
MDANPRPLARRISHVRYGLLLLALVFVIGTVGFMVIERWSLLDALFMTTITLTTVGYDEVRPLDTAGRIFDIGLILVGVTAAAYTFSGLAETFIEQRFFRSVVRERRMHRKIEELREHFIVCGYGRVGMNVALELARESKPFVVIEQDAALAEACRAAAFHVVIGDATQDTILLQAGIERAKGVVTALNSDAANLYITLSCRSLRANLYIVARASDESVEPKFVRAGANRVLCPYSLTGRRMAEMVIEPQMTSVVEVIGRHSHLELYLEEVIICADSPLVGRPIGDAMIRVETGAAIVAIKKFDGALLANPSPHLRISIGETLVAIGTRDQLRRFAALAGEDGMSDENVPDALSGAMEN